MKHLIGDAAYDRRRLPDVATLLYFTTEAVRRLEGNPPKLSNTPARLLANS